MNFTKNKLERAIHKIRQRIFDMPPEKQARATKAIDTLKARIQYPSGQYHWRYAAE